MSKRYHSVLEMVKDTCDRKFVRAFQKTLAKKAVKMNVFEERIEHALEVAMRYGGIDGNHHKAWVIDQMVRALTEHKYNEWVKTAKAGDEGPETYDWDTGIAP